MVTPDEIAANWGGKDETQQHLREITEVVLLIEQRLQKVERQLDRIFQCLHPQG